MSRGYVKTEKRFLIPTSLGVLVVDGLCGNFSFVEYEFTRSMEQALDDIAAGKEDYSAVISKAHARLKRYSRPLPEPRARHAPSAANLW